MRLARARRIPLCARSRGKKVIRGVEIPEIRREASADSVTSVNFRGYSALIIAETSAVDILKPERDRVSLLLVVSLVPARFRFHRATEKQVSAI